jgi:hypothetical protein
MGIVRNFEKHKYTLPTKGEGIVDTVADFVSKNKDTLKDVGKAVSSVSGVVGNISDAVKAAKRFNELRELQGIKNQTNKLSPAVISELQAPSTPKSESLHSKKGDGFEKF